MAGSITLRNGFCWAGSGWEFRSILNEISTYIDHCDHKQILDKFNDPNDVVQAVDLLDLSDTESWSSSDSNAIEDAIKKAHQFILENGRTRTLGEHPIAGSTIIRIIELICYKI